MAVRRQLGGGLLGEVRQAIERRGAPRRARAGPGRSRTASRRRWRRRSARPRPGRARAARGRRGTARRARRSAARAAMSATIASGTPAAAAAGAPRRPRRRRPTTRRRARPGSRPGPAARARRRPHRRRRRRGRGSLREARNQPATLRAAVSMSDSSGASNRLWYVAWSPTMATTGERARRALCRLAMPVGQARAEVEQHRGGPARHPGVAVGGAGRDALEQRQHAAHLGCVVERGHEVHLRGAGVGEADVDAGVDQGLEQGARTDHRGGCYPGAPGRAAICWRERTGSWRPCSGCPCGRRRPG